MTARCYASRARGAEKTSAGVWTGCSGSLTPVSGPRLRAEAYYFRGGRLDGFSR
jgi:hypothetical protein